MGAQCRCACQEEHLCACSSSCWSARSFASAWRMVCLSFSSITGIRSKHFRFTLFHHHSSVAGMEILSSPWFAFSRYQDVTALSPALTAGLAVGSRVWNFRSLDSGGMPCSDQEAENKLSWLLPWSSLLVKSLGPLAIPSLAAWALNEVALLQHHAG